MIVQYLCMFLTVLRLEKCEEALEKDSKMLKFVLETVKLKECVKKLLKKCYLQ